MSKPTMPKQRNAAAVAAHFRNAGAMHHKNLPRGGASNEMRDLMEDYQEHTEVQDYLEMVWQSATENEE